MASLAQRVRDYLITHPAVGEALRLGIANNASVARRIGKELGIGNQPAIVAACRRYPRDRLKGPLDPALVEILRKSRVQTRTRVASVTLSEGRETLRKVGELARHFLDREALFRVVQVSRGVVVILDEDSVGHVLRSVGRSQVVQVRTNLSELAIVAPPTVEETPGVMSLLSSLLAARRINVVQAMICHTDHIYLLAEGDLRPAADLIGRVLG
ncbi:MAG TPA: hypothetical protein VFF67_06595 [Thermoplasmata archaeon]|nr:hypothetical protein [Thermoplasmata archaeon]